ncbi:hypothetical protein [Nostoc sp. PA-18-2419]|uniref:hypothetical protein n=1 Tax=Nostoc sp. PA-18-2419 TaxID=2575443 RepID=UPI001679D400|nr:hypothetical protein [Nostoc sp. PA-18-2419]
MQEMLTRVWSKSIVSIDALKVCYLKVNVSGRLSGIVILALPNITNSESPKLKL